MTAKNTQENSTQTLKFHICELLPWEVFKHLTENVREQINILTKRQAFKRKWKKISYTLSLSLSESVELTFTYLTEKERYLIPPILIAHMATNTIKI